VEVILNVMIRINFIWLQSLIAYPTILAIAFAAGLPAPYHSLAPDHGLGPVYQDGPACYQYEYHFQVEYSGVNFGKNELRDGYSTAGQYRVLLQDSRTQILNYKRKEKNFKWQKI